jgi:phage gp46-like protein
MATVSLREIEAGQGLLLWDSVWDANTFSADWQLAGPDETFNRGGLRATSALETAVIISLWTEQRVPDDHPLRYLADDDPGGWWGDGLLLEGEKPLGSLLWLLRRAPLTPEVVRWAASEAERALAHLVEQGAAVKVETFAEGNALQGRLELTVNLYGKNGTRVYDRRFEVIWNQVAR